MPNVEKKNWELVSNTDNEKEIIKRKWHPIPPYWPRYREEHGTSKSFFSASSAYACVNGLLSLDENVINACACACVARENQG